MYGTPDLDAILVRIADMEKALDTCEGKLERQIAERDARIERLRESVDRRDRLLSTGCGIKLTAEEYTWWNGSSWGPYHTAKRYATHDEAVAALAGTDGRGCCIAGFPSIVEVPHPLEAEVARLREQAKLSHEMSEARIAELEAVSDYQRQSNEGLVGRIAELEAERDRLGEDVMRLRAGSCPHCCGYCREFERSKVAGRP